MKRKRKDLGLTSLMLLGAGFALMMIVAVSFVFALISSFTKNPTSMTGAVALVALLLAGAISGFTTARANGEGGTLVGILSAIISAGLILVIGLIFGKGKLGINVFINTASYVAVSVFLSILGKKRIKRRRRKYA